MLQCQTNTLEGSSFSQILDRWRKMREKSGFVATCFDIIDNITGSNNIHKGVVHVLYDVFYAIPGYIKSVI